MKVERYPTGQVLIETDIDSIHYEISKSFMNKDDRKSLTLGDDGSILTDIVGLDYILNQIINSNIDESLKFNELHSALNSLQTGKRKYGKSVHRDLLNIIVDIETLGTNVFLGSPVCYISAVVFYYEDGELHDTYCNIPVNYLLDYYKVDDSTLRWWKDKGELYNEIILNNSGFNLTHAILLLLSFIIKSMVYTGKDDFIIYGNSNTFDLTMLSNHLLRYGIMNHNSQLFYHYKERDARPLLSLNLCNRVECFNYAKDKLLKLGVDPSLCVEHNSLFDAYFEGKQLMDTLDLIYDKL